MALAWLLAISVHVAVLLTPGLLPRPARPASPAAPLNAHFAVSKEIAPEPAAPDIRNPPRYAEDAKRKAAAPATAAAEAPTLQADAALPDTPDAASQTSLNAASGSAAQALPAAATTADPKQQDARQRCPVQVEAVFPRHAIRAGVASGRVALRLHLAADGRVEQAEVLHAEPEAVFDTAALAAAMQWRCLPPEVAGASLRVSFVFRLE